MNVHFQSEGRTLCATALGEIEDGSAAIVILVHGWGGSRADLGYSANRLARWGYRVLVPDLSGHGASSGIRSQLSRPDHLADVIAAYDFANEWPRAYEVPIFVVGHSYGAYCAALLSGRREIDGLVLMAPALYPDLDWDTPKESLDKVAYREYRTQVAQHDTNRALGAIHRSAVPILVIASSADEYMPPNTVESYIAATHRWKLICIEGGRHTLNDEQSKYATRAMAEWFSDLPIL